MAQMHLGIAVGAGHAGIDLGDDQLCPIQGCALDIHADPHAAVAMTVRRRDLQQHGLVPPLAAPDQFGDLAEENRGVIGSPLADRLPHLFADKKRVIPEMAGKFLLEIGSIAIGEQLDEFHIIQPVSPTAEGRYQFLGRSTARPHEHPPARSNMRNRLIGSYRHASVLRQNIAIHQPSPLVTVHTISQTS